MLLMRAGVFRLPVLGQERVQVSARICREGQKREFGDQISTRARGRVGSASAVARKDVLRLIIPPDLQSLPGARGKAWGAQVWAEQSLTRSSSRRQLHPRPRPRPFVPARGGSRTRPGESSSLADCGQLGCLLR